ncbi:MAG: PHP domain-containing protein [Candidatus Omnitrophota bacterium]
MERSTDLHVHTCFSDGTFSPEEVVDKAIQLNLSCVALTDHDCVDGVRPAIKAARGTGLEIIAGVEMTAQEKGVEVHILGFFVDLEDSAFLERLKLIREYRVNRIYKMVDKLKKYNVDVDPEEVLKVSGPGSVGRVHLAAVLEKRGYAVSIKEAFQRYIGDKGPCYVSHPDVSAKEAIAELKRIGAVTVFAHPHLMGRDEFIPAFIEYGLDGLEVYHSEHSPAVSRRYLEIAETRKLLVTGGSDCHGLNKGEVLMGTVRVSYELVERLRECATRMNNT